jgi:hypothetical protein
LNANKAPILTFVVFNLVVVLAAVTLPLSSLITAETAEKLFHCYIKISLEDARGRSFPKINR